mgnify:CR=1 FL=1
MKYAKNKRAELMMGLALLAIVFLIFVGWLITINKRECTSDSYCGEGYYCGSDFGCHKMPVYEKTVVDNSLVAPAVIIGLAIVLAAIVLRWNGGLRYRRKEHHHDDHSEH